MSTGKAIVFGINYVGSDPKAAEFVAGISNDAEVKGMVYCNVHRVDTQIAMLGNGPRNHVVSAESARSNRCYQCTLTFFVAFQLLTLLDSALQRA